MALSHKKLAEKRARRNQSRKGAKYNPNKYSPKPRRVPEKIPETLIL